MVPKPVHAVAAAAPARDTSSQSGISFELISKEKRELQVVELFDMLSAQQSSQAAVAKKTMIPTPHDTLTYNFVTQNVRGFSRRSNGGPQRSRKQGIDEWMRCLKTSNQHGRLDVVLLQETHVQPGGAREMIRAHAAPWGFQTGPGRRQLSFWSETSSDSGGVAILVNPFSRLTDCAPFLETDWTANLCAMKCALDGRPMVVICVYGPRGSAAQHAFYTKCAQLSLEADFVLVGGDFNCTLEPEFDRTHAAPPSRHDSTALRDCLHTWQVEDALTQEMLQCDTAADIMDFTVRHHTYAYKVGGEGRATSRIDRWYTSESASKWTVACETILLAGHSDHDGVLLRIADPTICNRIKKVKRVYPPPAGCVEAVQEACSAWLAVAFTLDQHPWDELAEWDSLKVELRRICLNTAREVKKKRKTGLRQRVRRLRAALEAAKGTPRRSSGSDSLPVHEIGVGELTRRLAVLTIDRTARIAALRAEITGTERLAQTWTQDRLFERYVHGAKALDKALFRRFSTKFGPITPLFIESAAGGDPSDPFLVPNVLAGDWRSTLQQEPPAEEDMETWFSSLPPAPHHKLGWDSLVASVSELEVLAAIKGLKKEKATGPDRMPNEWYKDHSELLAPMLAKLFTACLKSGAVPKSFRDAIIFCIPKVSKPRTGLDFRPIALLNSDYKLLTRILATRLAPLMQHLTHEAQNGFVQGRNIHDTIDFYSAAQRLVRLGLAPAQAVMILLDFKKAYDSLDREFLQRALRWHGIPDGFARLVRALHDGTTARFQANGFLSDPLKVHNGIRQGCPLAPLLFILALDLLFRRVHADPNCPGLAMVHEEGIFSLPLAGYADDLALFLNEPAEEPHFLRIIEHFGAASGLKLNKAKCSSVCLHPSGPTTAHRAMEIPPAERDAPTRYLGIPISSAPNTKTVWAATARAIHQRLVLAAQKSSDVEQRCRLANAIIVPKILYVARHSWPSATIASELAASTHNFVWHGKFSVVAGEGRRALLNADHSRLPVRDGGIGEPDVEAELRACAASAVARWAQGRTRDQQKIGEILLWDKNLRAKPGTLVLPVQHVHTGRAAWRPTIWATGAAMLAVEHGSTRTRDELEGIQSLLRSMRAARSQCHWDRGWWHCDFTTIQSDLHLLRGIQKESRGKADLRWLPVAQIFGHGLLTDGSGDGIARASLNQIAKRGDSLEEVLQWRWIADGVVAFQCRSVQYPMATAAADQFRWLCEALMANYPALASRPVEGNCLSAYFPTEQEWTLAAGLSATTLLVENYPRPPAALGQCRTMAEAEHLAVSHSKPKVKKVHLLAHPDLSRLEQVWAPEQRWVLKRKVYKENKKKAGTAAAIAMVEQQAEFWRWRHDRMGVALATLSWRQIQRLPGSTSRDRSLLFKVKANRLSGWDVLHDRVGCPHESCADMDKCDAAHIMWECPAAQAVWAEAIRPWRALGAWPESEESPWLTAIFSLQGPDTPAALWKAPALRALQGGASSAAPMAHAVLSSVWRAQVFGAMHTIWRWRQSGLPGANTMNEHACAVLVRQVAERRIHYDLMAAALETDGSRPARTAILMTLKGLFKYPPRNIPTTSLEDAAIVLCFDGGSRGNPGPGGAGAVLVRADRRGPHADILWAGSVSLAHKRTTNNRAEYMGLIWGLQAALNHAVGRVHVVGDSAMILNQMRTFKAPKSRNLQPLHAKARILADSVGILSWTHHYRAHNKMADHLANMAMDSFKSAQSSFPTTHPQLIDVASRLENDIGFWQQNNQEQH